MARVPRILASVKIVRAIFTAGGNMRVLAGKFTGTCTGALVLALVLTATSVGAKQKNKDKKKNTPASDTQGVLSSVMPPVPDSQAVEQAVGEALGYWQIGDLDSLHKYYSDDVVVVSGAWEPPMIGWDNFVKSYQAQRAQVPNGRMDRSNTLIKVNGSSAWATYQFLYSAVAEGKIAVFHGHTTVILNKQADRWVIVLNHSSIVDSTSATQPTSANSAQPARP
jgi:ketosteroid isomerase-like protein